MTDFIFLGSKITADSDSSYEIKRHLLLGRKAMTNLDSIWKSRDIALPTKVHIVKAMVFPVVMYECESSTRKNWCFWTVMLEKTLENPLDCKEIKPVWIFIGRTDAETLILWPPIAKNWLIGKDPDAGKDWGHEKGTREDEVVWWHYWLNEYEFKCVLGDGEGQWGLASCNSLGREIGTWLRDWTMTTKVDIEGERKEQEQRQ